MQDSLYDSMDSKAKCFVVKTYYGVYKCQKEWVWRRCTSNELAAKYIDSFRNNDEYSQLAQKIRTWHPPRACCQELEDRT